MKSNRIRSDHETMKTKPTSSSPSSSSAEKEKNMVNVCTISDFDWYAENEREKKNNIIDMCPSMTTNRKRSEG